MSDTNNQFDPAVANQLTTLALTNAINQQQLNSVAARNQVANANTSLTLGVQLQQMAALKQIFQLSPMEAAASAQLTAMGDAAKLASMRAANGV